MIDPFMHCEKCKASFHLADARAVTAKRKWGFYWKCLDCGAKNKWEAPDDDGGRIML